MQLAVPARLLSQVFLFLGHTVAPMSPPPFPQLSSALMAPSGLLSPCLLCSAWPAEPLPLWLLAPPLLPQPVIMWPPSVVPKTSTVRDPHSPCVRTQWVSCPSRVTRLGLGQRDLVPCQPSHPLLLPAPIPHSSTEPQVALRWRLSGGGQ